ncbi:MAG: MFS transporter [Bacteroidota bacterium]|nr:MFS transporter [Bacteroidota bacterium]
MERQLTDKAEEHYLINESPEVAVGENTIWSRYFKAFPALQNRNYRIYFFGQFFSLIGTWLQIVAQGWLVLQLTSSPFLIGLVAALATAPSLLFSLFGGVVVDRFSKKKILYFTQSASMVLALALGIITNAGLATVPVIGTIAFLMGTVNAVDAPARQSLVPELIQKAHLPSAIALNSGIFNAARVIGPGLAGLLIAWVGIGGAFIANGLSYIAVLVALWFVRIQEQPAARALRPLAAIREGIQYSFSHPVIQVLLIFVGMLSIFGWSYTTIMPVIARETYGLDAKGLGYLYSATGVGALLATYLVGSQSGRVSPLVFIIGGNTLFAASLLLFSFINHFTVALGLLFFIGLGLLSQSSMSNTLVQGMVKQAFRGRVMSIYILMFLGMAPIGNFEIGYLTEHLGVAGAFRINAAIVFLTGLFIFLKRKRIIARYRLYKQQNGDDE